MQLLFALIASKGLLRRVALESSMEEPIGPSRGQENVDDNVPF
jgi:hypothetical protein